MNHFNRFGRKWRLRVGRGGLSPHQGRSAVTDIPKVLGVSEFQILRLTEHVPRASAGHVAAAVATAQECRDSPWHEEPSRTVRTMASFLNGFPRHSKMRPCGAVLSGDPITALTPTFTSREGLRDHALRNGGRQVRQPRDSRKGARRVSQHARAPR